MRNRQSNICILVAMSLFVFCASSAAYSQGRAGITVSGRVFLPDNQPAIQFMVNIAGGNGFKASARTDGRGGYRFEGIPPSLYTLAVTLPQNARYYAESVSVDTTNGNLFTADIFLRNPVEAPVRKEKSAQVISLKEASQNIPKEARKAFEKAQEYRQQKKFDAALVELEKSLRIFPDYFQALTEMGIVEINSGRLQEAVKNFDKAIAIFADYEPALSGAGYCLLTLGEYERSISMLERAVEIDSTHAQNFMFLGLANLALSRWQNARQFLERALKLDAAGAVSAHMYLADAFAGQHLYAQAAEELHTYLEKNPQAPNAERLRQREKYFRSQK